ncbi:MAG: hypothetical protein ABI690_28540 [Chloroflexota bacterium]
MRYPRLLSWGLLALLSFGPLIAATGYDVCSELVKTALQATNDVCEATSRNSACYGHLKLQAEPQPGFGPFSFDKVGDTVSVGHLNSLRLSPMDMLTGTWGVALLRLQADIPDDKPQNVNLLLFGDVEVKNLAPEAVLINVLMNSAGNVNVRRDPENTAFVMGTLSNGQSVTARGRSDDSEWIYIDIPGETNQKGWVYRSFVRTDEDLSTLNVIQPNLTQYGPMQAFYLKTGSKQTSCEEAPNDGLLVQTPEGIAEVRLWINEVKIRLGSTAFIQSSPGNQMTIKTLEGAAHVEALGVEQVAVAGTGVTVQLNQNSGASAPPSAPKAYKATEVNNLPVDNLDREIVPVVQEDSTTVESTPEATAQVVIPPVIVPSKVPATAVPSSTDEPTVSVQTATSTVEPSATTKPPTSTSVPFTPVPPTDVPPPTAVLPTDAPPATAIPPTAVPPTDEPPTSAPPTAQSAPQDQPTAGAQGASPATSAVSGKSTQPTANPPTSQPTAATSGGSGSSSQPTANPPPDNPPTSPESTTNP